MRNRLPSRACNVLGKVPYEVSENCSLTERQLVDHFRTIGCVCYVVVPHELRVNKPKVSWKGMMMGYSDEDGRKGYYVRSLKDGKIRSAARNQVIFYEFKLAYPQSVLK